MPIKILRTALGLSVLLALAGCASSAPGTAPENPAQGGTVVTPDAPSAFTPVDWSQLPEWVPTDLPMPSGDFRWAIPFDGGIQIDFELRDAAEGQKLVDALKAKGFEETQYVDHPSGNGATWTMESPTIRAGVVLSETNTAKPLLTYNVQDK